MKYKLFLRLISTAVSIGWLGGGGAAANSQFARSDEEISNVGPNHSQ